MDEFCAIADDLSVWEQHVPTYTARSLRKANPAPVSLALKLLHGELQHLAVLTCIMTSAANALEMGSGKSALAAMIIDFCPKQLATNRFPFEDIAQLTNGDQIIEELQELQTRLSFAQLLTQHLDRKFCQDAATSAGDIEILADAWRRASASIFNVLTSLGADRQPISENTKLVIGFLKNCIGGGSPCLNDNGELEMPGWAERRKSTRIASQHTAQASTGGDFFEVSVLNASTIGLGLTGHAKNGEHTTVVFPDGRQVSGIVKWSEEGRFGLQLDRPLEKTDSLLSAGASAH